MGTHQRNPEGDRGDRQHDGVRYRLPDPSRDQGDPDEQGQAGEGGAQRDQPPASGACRWQRFRTSHRQGQVVGFSIQQPLVGGQPQQLGLIHCLKVLLRVYT